MAENNTTNMNFKSEEESSISFADIWALIWGYKWWYIFSLAVFLSLGTFYLFRTPKEYQRSIKVLIDESSQDATMRNLGVASAGMMRMRSVNSVENELEAFASPDLMLLVVNELNLQTQYVEQQPLRERELYDNCPFQMVLAGENPRSGFSFVAKSTGENKLALSEFKIGKNEIPNEIHIEYGDTVMTPVGLIALHKMQTKKPFNYPISVTWINSMAMAKDYSNRLSVSLVGKESSILEISINDAYPRRAELILASLVDAYNKVWVGNKNRAAIKTTEFINERLIVIERDLATIEEALKNYKADNNLVDIKTSGQAFINESSLYAGKAFEVNSQLSIAEYIKEYLNNPANKLTLIPSNLGLTNISVETQISEYNEIVLQRDRLIKGSGQNNPLITELNESLLSIHSAILRSVENLIASLKLQRERIESQENHILSRIASNSGQELQLLAIERQQQITQDLYIYLLQKREENELAALVNVGNTRIIMSPNGPAKPVSPKTTVILFAMVILGLGLPFAVFFVKKMLDKSIKCRADLGNLTVPFLSELPRFIKKEDRFKKFKRINDDDKSLCKIVVESGSRDMMNEAFRVFRTNIDLMLGKNESSKVIMFTSFNPNAGKTFTVMNAAASMALKDCKVALLDFDLRKASLSRTLGLVHTGTAAYLNGKIDDYKPFMDQLMPNLYVLPIGTLPPNPTELLLSDRFTQLIEGLRNEFDYVFIDCPPIDIVADASIITEVADMSVFVMRANQMKKDVLPQIQQLYLDKKYRHMAIALNCVDIQFKKYGYGKSSYGYGYGYTDNDTDQVNADK